MSLDYGLMAGQLYIHINRRQEITLSESLNKMHVSSFELKKKKKETNQFNQDKSEDTARATGPSATRLQMTTVSYTPSV